MNAYKKQRSLDIDFVKGVLIILMVMYHLDGHIPGYGWQHEFVYSFHMPGFLLISGFLLNVKTTVKALLKSLRVIAISYLLFVSIRKSTPCNN